MLSRWRGEFVAPYCIEWAKDGTLPPEGSLAHNLVIELETAAQSLANLEAAVRREYAGLVEAAEAWAKAERLAGSTNTRIQRELETLKNG